MTMMFLAKHSDKVGGGISYMQACYGKLTKETKVEKVGIEKLKNLEKRRRWTSRLEKVTNRRNFKK